MGKNLKGKECGKGISQKKDCLYCARYADKHDVFIPSDKNNLIAKHPMNQC